MPGRRSSVNGVAKRELDEKKTDEEPWKRGRRVDSGVFNLGVKLREVKQEVTRRFSVDRKTCALHGWLLQPLSGESENA